MQIIGKQITLSTLNQRIDPNQGLGWVHPTRDKPGSGFKQPIWINSNKKMITVKIQVIQQPNTFKYSTVHSQYQLW
jgi:hypothetical protein